MKIFGFYISRTDWKSINELRDDWYLYLTERIAYLEIELEKARRNDMPRDPETGRFVSKFKRVHDQLRAEVKAGKYEPGDQVPHYDDIKKALKLKEFGE